jgi:hypothetical protein
MDELGFFHFPYAGMREGALFPNRHEPSGVVGRHANPLPAPQYKRATSERKNIGVHSMLKTWKIRTKVAGFASSS